MIDTVVRLACAAALAAAAPTFAAEPAAAPEKPSIALHGFVSATVFVQDATTGPWNGQGSLFTVAEPGTDETFLGGDLRQTRLQLAATGPAILSGRATPRALVEADFFGGNTGGAFGDESVGPRLRLAYAELVLGDTTFQVGQNHGLIFAMAPVSLAHVAFPASYAAGGIGWRFPGVMVFHRIPLAGTHLLELAVSATRGSWSDADADLPLGVSYGEASSIPQVEARAMLSGKPAGGVAYSAFLVGHYDRKDLSGVGATAPEDGVDGWAAELGGKVSAGPLQLAANGWTGRAVGQLFGAIVQFGDIQGWGAWAQAGWSFTDTVSAHLFAGMDDPDDADVREAGATRLRNVSIGALAKYCEGPYTLGLEYYRYETKAIGGTRTADQGSLTAMYAF
ncbi:hypothetical protein [Anaeromyxobacter sp. PSR-1]|uniref:hypothetical protein n=1 Tax=unclassified Anaeromyxobacter TaxID=2620896 RepID=UPI0005E76ECE|nr:hypothetical protein [Anaeromyxobacter sp. PSR-1]GAO02484.1 hypothetical protein PSR1_01356 [Anaeromyxobacter sp. PSR-1]